MEYMHIGLVLVSVLTVTLCQISVGPQDTAGRLGSRVQLNCSADVGSDFLEWKHYLDPDLPNGERIWLSLNPDVVDDDRFEVVYDTGAGKYDLVIKYLSEELAGGYTCLLYAANDVKNAQVISLGDSKCVPEIAEPPMPPNPPLRPEGAQLTFNCRVPFEGAIVPALRWVDDNKYEPDQEYMEEVDDDGNRFVVAIANVTASAANDALWYHCEVSFEHPIDYTDTCGSYYEVQHAVSNIASEPEADEFENEIVRLFVGDHINCTATGRPEPTFHWFNDVGAIYEGYRLVLTDEMLPLEDDENDYRLFTCRAENTISGTPRQSTIEIKVHVEAADPEDGESTQTEPWVIAVACVIPLMVVAAIVIVGVFFVMRRNKKNNDAGTTKKDMADMEKDNKGYPGGGPIEEPGPPARVAAPPPQGQGSVNYNPQGRAPPNMPPGGVPVMPMTQQGYPGRASPGYADLGVKHISGSASSLNTSHDSLAVNQFMGDERSPGTPQGQGHQNPSYHNNHHPGYQNAPGQGPPQQQYAPQGQGSDTVV